MKAVVDTNVVAYFLLGTPNFVAEAREFWNHADELLAPGIWEAFASLLGGGAMPS